MIFILFLLCPTFSATLGLEHAPESCNFAAEVGLNFYECQDHGVNYYVSVPDGCATGGCGLIVDIPGFTMSAQGQNSLTGIREKGNAANYIVMTAESRILDWRPNDEGWKGNTHVLLEDIGDLIEALNVDEDKIHITGFSQGCYLTWSLLCAATHEIASVACLGASADDPWAVEDDVKKCYKNEMSGKPKRAVMYHTGKFDDISPISAGKGMKRKVQAWLEDFEFQFKEYKMKNTMLWPTGVAAEGHCIPASTFYSSQAETGLNDYDWGTYAFLVCADENGGQYYDWGQEVVDFFVANPKPATDTYSETVCDASIQALSLSVLSKWNVNIVIYGFALFGLFSSMMFLCGVNARVKNDFSPVEQNNEL